MNSNGTSIETLSVLVATVPLGPAQRSLRITHADDTITLEIGWPDPWRPERRLVLPADVTPALIEALASVST